ncbi:two-component system response regulator CreB [bacterium]|nr:two-component system response regulator CreB [bacterium]
MVKGEILLIEDETAIAQNIIYALNTEGYKIFWAKQGRLGLKRFNNKTLLILLDIGLPDMSGFDVCREIRKKSMVPIIFITARKSDVDTVLGLELGGDDYIIKPFSPRAMVARVRALLRRTTAGSKTIVPEDKQCKGMPFGIDEERKQITFYRSKLELTRYEYLILKTLLEHPGRVYSRQQLMQQIWIEPESSLERTVDAHVKSMRKKMKKVSPRHEVILTHRGLGYSLKEDW